MSPVRFRLPPEYEGGRGILRQDEQGSWVQEPAAPGEDLSGLTLVGKEALADLAMDPRLGGPPNPTDPALQRVRARPAAPSPTAKDFESMLAYAPGGQQSAQQGPQQPAGAAIPPGAMGNAARVVGDGVMGGAHGGHGGGAAPTSGAIPPGIADLLERARQDSRQRRLAAALGRSGALIAGGITRGAGGTGAIDEPGWAALAQEADRPMAEAQGRAAEMMAQRQYEQQIGSARALRAVVSNMLPDLPREALEQADPATLLKVVELARKGDEASRKAAHDLVMERIGMARASAAMANAQATRELARSNVLEKDVQKLGKQTEDMAALNSDIGTVLKYANQKGPIPGAGKWDSIKPDILQSKEDTEVRQATMRVVVTMLRLTSGVAVTPQEAERFMEANGWGPGATEDRWKAGVKAFIRDQTAKLKAQQAKFRPEVVETLQQRGGYTAEQLPTGGDNTGAGVRMRGPSGQTGMVDAAEVAEAEANGWKRI